MSSECQLFWYLNLPHVRGWCEQSFIDWFQSKSSFTLSVGSILLFTLAAKTFSQCFTIRFIRIHIQPASFHLHYDFIFMVAFDESSDFNKTPGEALMLHAKRDSPLSIVIQACFLFP